MNKRPIPLAIGNSQQQQQQLATPLQMHQNLHQNLHQSKHPPSYFSFLSILTASTPTHPRENRKKIPAVEPAFAF